MHLSRFRTAFFKHSSYVPVSNTRLIEDKPGNNYLYKIQFQKVKPELHQEYKDLYQDYFKTLSPVTETERKEHVGSWMTWYGSQDEAVHLWRYKGNYSSHKFSNSSKAKSQDANYIKFREERGKMLVSRRNDLIFEFGFCPQIKAFQSTTALAPGQNLIYEFRQYELKPGKIYNWASHWDAVFKSKMRGIDNEFVGAFFSDIGKLNSIYYIWAYPSLEARKSTRDKAWEHENWPTHVTTTQEYCRSMNSQILLPMAHSPLQ